MASHAVSRVKNDADPALPNTVLAEPLPKAAPTSAPFPCCRRTSAARATASATSSSINTVSKVDIVILSVPSYLRPNGALARTFRPCC